MTSAYPSKSKLTEQLLALVDDNPYALSPAFHSISDLAHEAYMAFRGYINLQIADHFGLAIEDDYYKMEYLIWRDDLGMSPAEIPQTAPLDEEIDALRTKPEYKIIRDREIMFEHLDDKCKTEIELDDLLVLMEGFMVKHSPELGVEPEAWKFEVLSTLNDDYSEQRERVEQGETLLQREDPGTVISLQHHEAGYNAEFGLKPKLPRDPGTVLKFPRK